MQRRTSPQPLAAKVRIADLCVRGVVRLALDERGGTLVEYAIIVALVAAVAVAAVVHFGKNVSGLLHSGSAVP